MVIDFTPALLVALVITTALVVRSIYSFSRAGPDLRDEVKRAYRGYSFLSFLRLGLASLAISFWLAAGGQYVAACIEAAFGLLASEPVHYFGALIGVAGATLVQFLVHLHRIPSSLLMSSNYKMSRFLPLWRRLTAQRVFIMEIIRGTLLIVAAIAAAPNVLLAGGIVALGQHGLFLILLSAPLIVCYWIEREPGARVAGDAIAGNRPNVLMVGSDTLRSDRMGFAGCERLLTPHIDALASRGHAFPNCYTPIARTAPSLISLFSGCWPHEHGVRYNYVADRETKLEVPLVPRIFRENGYRTISISDWAGSDLGKFELGFAEVQAPADQWNLKTLIRQGPKDLRLYLSLFAHNAIGKRLLPDMYYLAGVPLTTELVHDTCSRLTELAHSQQPFFLNLFMATTHPPFGSEYPYYCQYSDPAYRGESKFGMVRLVDPFDIIRSQREPKEAFDLSQIQALYDGCVRRFDDAVGDIVGHLNRVGLANNTIVVVYSDHGMELFEHDTWGQGNSALGDASPRVPLVIVDPRATGPGVDSRLVRTIDLAPTLLEVCGLKVDPLMSGLSLRANSALANDPEREIYFETGIWLARPPGQLPDHLDYPELLDLLTIEDRATGTLSIKPDYRGVTILARDRMVRNERWKLVRLALKGEAQFLLFDLASDAECHHDVSAQHPEVVADLKMLMRPYLEADSALVSGA